MSTTVVKDYLGNVLSVGDEVVFVQQNYRNYLRGTIITFTPKFVRISWTTGSATQQILQTGSQLIKVVN
jgi:hypothetical protein